MAAFATHLGNRICFEATRKLSKVSQLGHRLHLHLLGLIQQPLGCSFGL